LVFFLITEFFVDTKDIHHLYLCCSIAGLWIAMVSLGVAWENNFDFSTHQKAHALVSWSPILISRNDLTILSLLAPFSMALGYQKIRSLPGILALISIVFSACAVVVFQSRGATLAMLIGSLFTIISLNPRKGVVVGLAILILFLVTDAVLGFPLVQRFSDLSNNRYQHWLDAMAMFSDAPLLGHGPHTFGLFSKTPWTHNLYIEILFGHGLIGLAAFGALLLSAVSVAWKTRQAESKELRIYGAGAFGAIIGFCLSGVLELSLIRQWIVLIFFLFLGVITKLSSLQTKGAFYERG
jgi:O-antigen ligase